MNTTTERKLNEYIDIQLKERRDDALRELSQELRKQTELDKGPEFVIETGVEDGRILATARRK